MIPNLILFLILPYHATPKQNLLDADYMLYLTVRWHITTQINNIQSCRLNSNYIFLRLKDSVKYLI